MITPACPPPLLAATFRANPSYELVLFEELGAALREALAELCRDPELYGVLRPRDGGEQGLRSVSCDTALLLSTLAAGAPLPGFVARKLGRDAESFIARLVLDGVLEVAVGGRFVSGAAAQAHVCGDPRPPAAEGRIAQLSVDALRYVAETGLSEAPAIVGRLYAFNTIPASPRLRRLFPEPGVLWAHLCPPASPTARRLADAWREASADAGSDPWRRFAHRHPSGAARNPEDAVHKLYVSPVLDGLPEAPAAAVEVLTDLGAREFKIGRGLGGVLRPDKLVAYFPTFDALAAAAERLRSRLSGCGAQGVPFTAPIDDAGLLSWGMDPPPRAALSWIGRESWRLWVTRRLAMAIVAAQGAPGGVEPWRFAVERVRLEGIDTRSWTPSARIWKEAPSREEQD